MAVSLRILLDRPRLLLLGVGLLVVLLCWWGERWPVVDRPRGVGAARWIDHRDHLRRDPAVTHYYTFQDATPSATRVKSTVWTLGSTLRFQGSDAPPLVTLPGRWDWKRAVQLDRTPLTARPFPVLRKTFSVEMWFQHHGMGSLPGPNHRTAGTLLAVGDGVWVGWRMTMRFPEQSLTFELGRPKPLGAVGVTTRSPVVADVWHHAVATWDGKCVRLYVDGVLAGATNYDGAFHPARPDSKFRVGFVGNGLGSVAFDIDELAIYDRVLSGPEILQDTHLQEKMSAQTLAHFEEADFAFQAGHFDRARRLYATLQSHEGLGANLRSLAALRLGECFREANEPGAALAQFAQVATTTDAWDAHRKTALAEVLRIRKTGVLASDQADRYADLINSGLLSPKSVVDARRDLARTYRQAHQFEKAIEQYERILALSNAVPPSTQMDVRLELARSWQALGDPIKARGSFRELASGPETTPPVRAIARFEIADSYGREKKYREAWAELAKVENTADMPVHLRREARERAQELSRIEHGLPGRDPLASRIRLPARAPASVEFFVAPDGNDEGSGKRDHPFATLEHARDTVRRLRRDPAMRDTRIDVVLRGGIYHRETTLILTSQDSGTKTSPVVYRAAEGETPRLSGGVRLTVFSPVETTGTGLRIPPAARPKIRQVDLRKLGLDPFPPQEPVGFRPMTFLDPAPPVVELFEDGRPMTLARWPDTGWVFTGSIVDQGNPSARGGVSFKVADTRPMTWRGPENVWVYGYWRHLWADHSLALFSINASQSSISTRHTPPNYGIAEGQPYYYFNAPEELDSPGEWYLDRSTGVLYLYPRSSIEKGEFTLSVLNSPLIEMQGVSHVIFQGLTVEHGRGRGATLTGGAGCLLLGCTLRNLAGEGVVVQGGTGHGVLGCDLYGIGRYAVVLSGGNRATLTPSCHFVENCHIHDFARIDRAQTPAVYMLGAGSRVAHCLIHDAPGGAIRIAGNENQVEFNEVHTILLESDDIGGLDIYDDPTFRGNVVQYNYWHHIGNQHPIGQNGVRLDDAICGTLIYGNVFYRCASGQFGAVNINGGKDNWIDNNLFIDCAKAVGLIQWSNEQWQDYLKSPTTLDNLFKSVDIKDPLYRERYPELSRLDGKSTVNHIWRNIAYRCGPFLFGDENNQDVADNQVTWVDPGLADAGHKNFAIRPEATILQETAFRRIPFEQIGLYDAEWTPLARRDQRASKQ